MVKRFPLKLYETFTIMLQQYKKGHLESACLCQDPMHPPFPMSAIIKKYLKKKSSELVAGIN